MSHYNMCSADSSQDRQSHENDVFNAKIISANPNEARNLFGRRQLLYMRGMSSTMVSSARQKCLNLSSTTTPPISRGM